MNDRLFRTEPAGGERGLQPQSLYQLTYYSTSLLPPLDAGGESEVMDILAVSQERNRARAVTGALTYNEFSFAQVLEGARRDVDDIFDSIMRDKRHTHVVVVEERWIERRDFAAWAMGYVGSGSSLKVISSNLQLRDIIASTDGNADALVRMMKFLLRSMQPDD